MSESRSQAGRAAGKGELWWAAGGQAALWVAEASVTVWALESQAGQGLLGHASSGPGLWLRTQSTSVQRPGVEAHGCNLPQETLKLPLVTQGLEAAAQTRGGREPGGGSSNQLCVWGEAAAWSV